MTPEIIASDSAASVVLDDAALRRIDLNLLVVFVMVAQCGSVRDAAGRLYLGPSGVSMALNRLRAMTADPLLVRGKRGLDLTSFGRELFEGVYPALAAITEAMRPAAFDPARRRARSGWRCRKTLRSCWRRHCSGNLPSGLPVSV